MNATRQDRFEGAILGLAIGDALGYPCEFRTREHIRAAFGDAGVTDFVAVKDPRWPEPPWILGKDHPPGTYTDDTQMSLAVAEALIEAGDGDVDALMRSMAARFVEWSRSDDNDRAPGNTCMTACRALGRGVPWREAGVKDSKGAGSAMRAVPIGLRYAGDRERLLEVGRASSVLTHGHPAAIEGAAAVALLTALALERATPEAMHRALLEICAPGSDDLRARLERLPALLGADPGEALGESGLGEAWVAEEAVACALWCFWRTPDDFRATVITAANTDGDSDTIACIAGGISGAYNGASAIPREWRERVENAAGLRDVAARLLAVS